jgi:tetratricopeptide (TPR) repeat protein
MVAIRLNNLGGLLHEMNRLEEAEPLFRRALTIDEESYGLEHPNVARELCNLAALLRDTNRPEEAKLHYTASVKILWRSLGAEHPNTQTVIRNYRIFLTQHRHLSEAEAVARIQAELAVEAPSEAER